MAGGFDSMSMAENAGINATPNPKRVRSTADSKRMPERVHIFLRNLRHRKILPSAWIRRYLEGCSNRGVENEERYGRRWCLLMGSRLLRQITTEDLRRLQTTMRARRLKAEMLKKKGQRSKLKGWSDATINRHFAFLRHASCWR